MQTKFHTVLYILLVMYLDETRRNIKFWTKYLLMFAALLNLSCYSLTANAGLSVCSGIVQRTAHWIDVSLESEFYPVC